MVVELSCFYFWIHVHFDNLFKTFAYTARLRMNCLELLLGNYGRITASSLEIALSGKGEGKIALLLEIHLRESIEPAIDIWWSVLRLPCNITCPSYTEVERRPYVCTYTCRGKTHWL